MKASTLLVLRAAVAVGVAVAALTGCELLVDLDRGEVNGSLPDGCAICTVPEGGEDAEQEASVVDGGDATVADAYAASTEGGGDAGSSDGGADGATRDSGVE